MRCLECGAETAERAHVCASCGAPVAPQVSVSADQAEDGSGDSSAPLPGESVRQTPGQRPEPSARRNALALAGLGFILLVAMTVLVWSVTTVVTRLSSSRSSARSTPTASLSSPASPAPSTFQASWDELQAEDCLTGSDLGLNTSNTWPDLVTVVPCPQRHIGEVFFAGNAWPRSQAYPGDNARNSEAVDRCNTAFTAYDGITNDNSAFTYTYIEPSGADDWASGDRWLVCVAYSPTSQYPGGAPMDYSIKGSQQ